MPQIQRNPQHPVVSDQKRKLDQQGQTTARRIHPLLLVERTDLLIHRRLARIAQGVLLIFFLYGFYLRRDALHLQHRLHLRNPQRQQRHRDDQRLNHYRPSPVGIDVFVSPLQPQKERPRNQTPPSEIHRAAQIRIAIPNGWHIHGFERGQFFRPYVNPLTGCAPKTAHSGTEEFDIRSVFGTRAHGTEAGFLRNLHGIAQRHHGGGRGIVGNKNGSEVLIPRTGPLERSSDRIAATDALHRQTQDEIREDQGGAVGGGIVVVVDARGGVGSGRDLVTESSRPRGRREDFSAFVNYRSFHAQHITLVEMESLPDYNIRIGIFEGDRGGSRERAADFLYFDRTVGVQNIKRRTQLIPQRVIAGRRGVSPQRKR